jgi:hypothetical protein
MLSHRDPHYYLSVVCLQHLRSWLTTLQFGAILHTYTETTESKMDYFYYVTLGIVFALNIVAFRLSFLAGRSSGIKKYMTSDQKKLTDDLEAAIVDKAVTRLEIGTAYMGMVFKIQDYRQNLLKSGSAKQLKDFDEMVSEIENHLKKY